ncbi:MAG: hypothetical protein HRU30_12555, partial [Rhodobacteraceae bacterium]|nr:hypothetical protein [Paracoccaceae bacterium]
MLATRLTAASLSFVLLSTTAHADVSANDVWSDWKSYLADLGYSVSAEESQTSGQVTVTDLSVELVDDATDGAGTVTMTFPQIVFSETGDGSVDIQLPEVTTFVIDGQDEDDDFTATVEFAQSGL